MRSQISTRVVSGNDIDQHSSMLGYVTLMLMLEPQQIYRIHENEKKRLYSRSVLDIEHGTFTPSVFTTTGGMGKECLMYHSR